MTVSYQYDVASSSTGGFFRLLWRWRGSIWKLLYKELLLFCGVYLCIAFTYDFLMSDYYKRYYERTVIFCSAFVEIIPLSFILGFYVSFTAHRWWQQYTAIPWPDKLMNIIALYVPGNDVTSRVLRRTLMRYLNLTLVLVLRSISIPVKRRFPTKEHLVEAGFMSRPELEMYSSVPSHEFNTFWIPCTWFVNLLREAKSECRITDSGGIKLIMEEFNEFRSKCGLLWSYDWVSIPLVYTQVVTLSTQAFFLASLLGRQHINPPKSAGIKAHDYGEYYIPVFTLLQFILYMGLLKLGEQLINPFGDDDEDFELNWIIDRHLKVSFLGVDILNSDPPPLIKDNYFDEMDIKLPYTEAAVAHKVKTYRGSVAAFHVPTSKHGLVIPEFDDDENGEDDEAVSTIQSNRDANTHTSSWSLFRGKRKLSSSIDSFNSETMVERGLEETEMPTLKANSSWHNFLASEGNENGGGTSGTGKASAPASAAAPSGSVAEDTQGIRGSDQAGGSGGQQRQYDQHGHLQPEDVPLPPSVKDRWKHAGRMEAPHGVGGSSSKSALKAANLGEIKQSSFESTDSSNQSSHVIIPMEEDGDSGQPPQLLQQQRPAAGPTARFFHFRKSPLQVFAKDRDKDSRDRDNVSLVNAPVSSTSGGAAFRTLGPAEATALLSQHRNSGGDRSSLSSVSLKSEVPVTRSTSSSSSSKPPKSLMKCHRTVDPKLRIRPFRSKVTFSEDTKAGDNTLLPEKRGSVPVEGSSSKYGSVFSKWDSSSDSVSSCLLKPSAEEQQEQPISLKRHHTFSESSAAGPNVRASTLKVSDIPFADLSKRRQSFDPTMVAKLSSSTSSAGKMTPLVAENLQDLLLNRDNWLHYQSLPNIQEEDQLQQGSQHASPTERSPPRGEAFSAVTSLTPVTTTSSAEPLTTALPVRVTPPTPSPPPYSRPTQQSSTNSLLPPQPGTPPLSSAAPSSTDSPTSWKDGGRRRSLKRQKSQDVPDEKLPPPPPAPIKSLPPLAAVSLPSPNMTTAAARIAYLNKQSSDESQTSNITEGSSSSTNQLKQPQQGTTTTTAAAAAGSNTLHRARKEDLKPRQASTESDTASYHTVNSYMLMEKSNSSSIDSFTSANSEANNNSSSSNGHSQPPKAADEATEQRPSLAAVDTRSPSSPVNGSSALRSYHPLMHHESSLVPTITFSQSTPSVTSQSSDDQNSPKWDDDQGVVAGASYQDRFASMEQVLEATAKQNAQRAAAAAAAAVAAATSSQQQQPQPQHLTLTIQGPDDEESGSASSTTTSTATTPTATTTTTQSTAIQRVNTAGNGNDPRRS